MKTSILGKFFILFLSFSISGCAEKRFDYFAEPTCAPPCFLGIVPGESNTTEVSQSIISSPYVDVSSVYSSGLIAGNWYPVIYSVDWKFIDNSEGVVWLSSDSKVAYIEYIEPKNDLKEFIKVYGEPSEIVIIPYWGVKSHVYLLYPDIGVILDINKSVRNQESTKVESSDEIHTITYVNKDIFYRLIHFFAYGDIFSENPLNELASIIQPWEGYGKYHWIDFWSAD